MGPNVFGCSLDDFGWTLANCSVQLLKTCGFRCLCGLQANNSLRKRPVKSTNIHFYIHFYVFIFAYIYICNHIYRYIYVCNYSSYSTTTTPFRYVKKCRNLGQTLEFLKGFCYKLNQPDPNNSQIIAFLESKFLNNKFLNTPKGCRELSYWLPDREFNRQSPTLRSPFSSEIVVKMTPRIGVTR